MNGKLSEFKLAKFNETIEDFYIRFPEFDKELIKKEFERLKEDKIYINDEYQVHKNVKNKIIHLSIKRLDKNPIHDWRDLQAIKNMILGEEIECLELYPAESRLVDSVNQYHLWGLLDENDFPIKFPFGFNGRYVVDENENNQIQNTKQRKL